MSLALAVHAYKNLLDTTPIEFVSQIETEQRPLMPSQNYKHSFKTAHGGMTEEDFKWLMK